MLFGHSERGASPFFKEEIFFEDIVFVLCRLGCCRSLALLYGRLEQMFVSNECLILGRKNTPMSCDLTLGYTLLTRQKSLKTSKVNL